MPNNRYLGAATICSFSTASTFSLQLSLKQKQMLINCFLTQQHQLKYYNLR